MSMVHVSRWNLRYQKESYDVRTNIERLILSTIIRPVLKLEGGV
jgi:hypothetical protein